MSIIEWMNWGLPRDAVESRDGFCECQFKVKIYSYLFQVIVVSAFRDEEVGCADPNWRSWRNFLYGNGRRQRNGGIGNPPEFPEFHHQLRTTWIQQLTNSPLLLTPTMSSHNWHRKSPSLKLMRSTTTTTTYTLGIEIEKERIWGSRLTACLFRELIGIPQVVHVLTRDSECNLLNKRLGLSVSKTKTQATMNGDCHFLFNNEDFVEGSLHIPIPINPLSSMIPHRINSLHGSRWPWALEENCVPLHIQA